MVCNDTVLGQFQARWFDPASLRFGTFPQSLYRFLTDFPVSSQQYTSRCYPSILIHPSFHLDPFILIVSPFLILSFLSETSILNLPSGFFLSFMILLSFIQQTLVFRAIQTPSSSVF